MQEAGARDVTSADKGTCLVLTFQFKIIREQHGTEYHSFLSTFEITQSVCFEIEIVDT